MEEYKINWISSWKMLSHILILLLLILGIYYLHTIYYKQDDFLLLYLMLIAYILLLIPTLVVYINYYSVNKGDVLQYNIDTKEFIFNHNGAVILFKREDIKEVWVYISISLHKKSPLLLPWDKFNHQVVVLNNNTRVTLTSLLMPGEIQIVKDSDKERLRISLFRLAKKSKILV